jgi:TolB-like protein
MSPDPDNEYFSDGMSEELLNLLVKVDGLRVPSRTSSFAFKDQNLDIRQVAQQLGVNHILEGSVRKAGNTVRITAQLIDVTTDTHLWSETYDRELKDIFAIQDEIATEIVSAMHIVLGTGIVDQRPTEELEAYTLYLHGRELFRQRSDPQDLMAARQLLLQAVSLDAQFAQAWALMAMVEATIPGYTKEDNSRYASTTMEYAEKALALDPTLVEARLALTQVLSMRNEPGMALEQYLAIVQQAPRHSQAKLWYAIDLYQVGYLAQAFEQISAAVDLDPVHATMLDWYARIAVSVDQQEPGKDAAMRSIQLGRSMGVVPIVQYNLAYGTVAGIERYLETFPYFEGFRWVFATRDDPAKLQQSLDWIKENQSGSGAAYMVLDLYRVAGSVDEYYDQLDLIHAYDETVDYTVWLPNSSSLRTGERFNIWAKERGYDALWRAQGPPDLCRLEENSAWVCDSPEALEELGSVEELGSE